MFLLNTTSRHPSYIANGQQGAALSYRRPEPDPISLNFLERPLSIACVNVIGVNFRWKGLAGYLPSYCSEREQRNEDQFRKLETANLS
jgi:hypothetical protein